MEDLSFDRYEVQEPLDSTDKTHGKMGHLCSSLCGAAMLRQQEKQAPVRNDGVLDMTYRELELQSYFDE